MWNTLLLCQHHSFQNGQAFCFASHGFQKLKIEEIGRSQVKKGLPPFQIVDDDDDDDDDVDDDAVGLHVLGCRFDILSMTVAF